MRSAVLAKPAMNSKPTKITDVSQADLIRKYYIPLKQQKKKREKEKKGERKTKGKEKGEPLNLLENRIEELHESVLALLRNRDFLEIEHKGWL